MTIRTASPDRSSATTGSRKSRSGMHRAALPVLLAGLLTLVPASLAQAADTTPPQTTITAGPTGVVTNPFLRYDFTADEPDSTFECSVDQGTPSFSPCVSGDYIYPIRDDGSWTFRVRATDAAGNTDATPATRTFTLDRRPVAMPDSYTTDLDTLLDVPAPGVTANDPNPLGDFAKAMVVSGPKHGTLALDLDGAFRYTPDEDYVGIDKFTYNAIVITTEGTVTSATPATVTLKVRAACDGVAATRLGTRGRDTITGTAKADVIVALGGADTITGAAANDRICGGSGADKMTGGLGADVLIGGSGNDVVTGEAGDDRLFGGLGADTLLGGLGNDQLDGGAGSPDTCNGGAGADLATAGCELKISIP